MKKRFLTMVMAMLIALSTCLGLVACGSKSDPNALSIYITQLGYGTEWLDASIEDFITQDWVKAKYGEVKVNTPTKNSELTFTQTKMKAGPSGNSYDLMFTTSKLNSMLFDTYDGVNACFEDLTSLLNDTVPNEQVTIKDKMKPDVLEAQYVVAKDDLNESNPDKHVMGMPWVDGLLGILVNETLVKQELGSAFTGYPRTTTELLAFAEQLKQSQSAKPAGQKSPVFVMSPDETYWGFSLHNWWAQYEGIENYHSFYEGKVGKGYSPKIAEQKGRLYALETLQSLIWAPSTNDFGYGDELNLLRDFQSIQRSFYYDNYGFMTPSGDWVENELGVDNDVTSVIKFINFPIVSQIVENLSFYSDTVEYAQLSATKKQEYENKLTAIIDQIDAGKTYAQAKEAIADLTESDFNRVYEARYIREVESGHVAYIPAYAKNKELAKDFLRYLATDDAIEIFMKTTNGCATPYQYDYSNLDFEISEMHKSALAIKDGNCALLPKTSFPLHYYGGLQAFNANTSIETLFCNPMVERKTAQQIYQEDIDYINREFTNIRNKAGI